jgi:hypothetical protein
VGVVHLDQEPAVFDAMLSGWAAQLASRSLKRTTIESGQWLVRRFAAYTNDYPWQWQPAHVDEFCSWLSSGKQPRALSTLRGYRVQLSLFCDYIRDPRYGWAATADPEELQAFFDYADDEVELIRNVGRKGALAACRDAVLFRIVADRTGQPPVGWSPG